MAASRTRHSNPDKPSTCGDVPIARPAGRPRPGRRACILIRWARKRSVIKPRSARYAPRPTGGAGSSRSSPVSASSRWSPGPSPGRSRSARPDHRHRRRGPVRIRRCARPAAPPRLPRPSPAAAAAAPGQRSARARARARQDLARARQDLARARQHPARATAGSGGHAAKLPKAARRACRPADVVLSLFASQDRYGPGQLPAFTVDVVSTSPRTCTFNVGPKFLAVVITARRRPDLELGGLRGRGRLEPDRAGQGGARGGAGFLGPRDLLARVLRPGRPGACRDLPCRCHRRAAGEQEGSPDQLGVPSGSARCTAPGWTLQPAGTGPRAGSGRAGRRRPRRAAGPRRWPPGPSAGRRNAR